VRPRWRRGPGRGGRGKILVEFLRFEPLQDSKIRDCIPPVAEHGIDRHCRNKIRPNKAFGFQIFHVPAEGDRVALQPQFAECFAQCGAALPACE